MTGPRKRLDELDAARKAATPGPWQVEGGDVWTVPEFDLHRFDVMGERVARTDLTDDDAALIVAAVNHLPALTSALRAVLAACDDLALHTVEPANDSQRGFIQGLDTAANRIRAALAPLSAPDTGDETT